MTGRGTPNEDEAPLADLPPLDEPTFEEAILETERDDISDAEKDEVCRLVRKCLRYDAADRISTAELLKEQWFYL